MMFEVPSEPLQLSPVATKALDLLFILHADHEQNASTSTVRLVGSTGANPYACVAAGIAALWGSTAAPSDRAQDARRDRRREKRRQGRRKSQGQELGIPPDGLRPSCVQEFRSARDDHSRDVPQGAERSPGCRIHSSMLRSPSRKSLKDPYFVERKLYQTSTFTAACCLQGAENSDRDVHGVCYHGPPAGSRTGSNSTTTRTRRLVARQIYGCDEPRLRAARQALISNHRCPRAPGATLGAGRFARGSCRMLPCLRHEGRGRTCQQCREIP